MRNFESLKYVIYRIFFAKQLNIDLRFVFKYFNRYMFILSDYILVWFVLNTETFVSMETFFKINKHETFLKLFLKANYKRKFCRIFRFKIENSTKKIKQLKK